MTQIKTSRPPNPPKQTGDKLTIGEVNELNDAINTNAQDFSDRTASLTSTITPADNSLTAIEGTSIPIKSHTTALPATASNGTIALDPVNNIMMYHKDGAWYKMTNNLAASLEDFKFKVDTGATTTFQLPLVPGGNYSCEVDWGDGNLEIITSDTQVVHDYGVTGIYTITINGNVPGFVFDNNADSSKLIEILESGGLSFVGTADDAFHGASNLTTIDNTISFKTTGVTSFKYFYRSCGALTQAALMDTSSATDFTQMFFACVTLPEIPALDTSSANDLTAMFRACRVVTSLPTLNTSNVTNFTQTFWDMRLLNVMPFIDTSIGTVFNRTWRTCNTITSFPALDLSSGQNFNQAWWSCDSLTNFPEMDFSSGTDFTDAWDDCVLNLTAVENILKSLVLGSKTGLSTSIANGSNVGISNWTTNPDTSRDATTNYEILTEPLGNPIHGTTGRGWTIATNI